MGDSSSEVKEEPKAGDMSERSHPSPSSPPEQQPTTNNATSPKRLTAFFMESSRVTSP